MSVTQAAQYRLGQRFMSVSQVVQYRLGQRFMSVNQAYADQCLLRQCKLMASRRSPSDNIVALVNTS